MFYIGHLVHCLTESKRKCYWLPYFSDYLNTKNGFILVSHDRSFLDNCVDHILSINKTNIEIQKGNFSSWWENKKRQDNFELAENDKLSKDINRLSDSSKRTGNWSHEVEKTKNGTRNSGSKVDKGYIGHEAAKMMKRSKAIQQRQQSAIDEKSKLLKNIESSDRLEISQLAYHKNQLVELDGISIYYGEKRVCSDVSFTIEQGDRIALPGSNGSGKSSIFKLICDEDIRFGMNRLILLMLFLACKLKSYYSNTHQPFFLSSMTGNFVTMLQLSLLNSRSGLLDGG